MKVEVLKLNEIKIPKEVGNIQGLITIITPEKEGFSIKFQCKPSKGSGFIIIDLEQLSPDGPLYWSEEEGGRFSGGPLYEKVFKTRGEAEDYITSKNIKGIAISHSQHWTGGCPIIHDSDKLAGNYVYKN